MKNLIIVVGVLFIVSAIQADPIDLYIDMMKDTILTCGKENGFTEQTAREIFDKDMEGGEENASCVRACTMKAGGFMIHKKLNLHNVNEFIKTVHAENPEMMEKLIKGAADCSEKIKDTSNECKMAFKYIQCFLDKHES